MPSSSVSAIEGGHFCEAVNALKRAIYTGRVGPARARRFDEMQAVADALSLLANIMMAWNTVQMLAVLDRWDNRRQIATTIIHWHPGEFCVTCPTKAAAACHLVPPDCLCSAGTVICAIASLHDILTRQASWHSPRS